VETTWLDFPNLTLLIRQTQAGDRQAEAQLFHLVYPYLKKVASRLMRRTRTEHTLSEQDVVHDVYLGRLRGYRGAIADRGHYIAFVTTAMKNHLIDRARHSRTKKRTPVSAECFPQLSPADLPYELILAVEREIGRIERMDWRVAQVVRLRYYAGCSWEETAAALGVSVKVVRNDWEFACEWLRKRLARKPY
jgi:RNA polymerase sigma factor (TIGR02999 family)